MGIFRTGAEAAQQASKGASFAKTHYFSLDDGQQALIRFLTDKDSWIVVDQHQNVPTKGKPEDWPKDATWPERMGAVCRRDQGVREMTQGDCFICDHIVGTKEVKKPSARVWALAVLREEVKDPATGQIKGVKDQTREVTVTDKDGKATGETTQEKAVVVVNMGFKNFFSALQGFGAHFGTVVDRDYYVKRNGTGTDTLYQIIPSEPITLKDGRVFDIRNADHAARYPLAQSLEDIVVERASDEFYARFFDTRVKAPASRSSSGGTAAVPPQDVPEGPSNDVKSTEELAALAARVKGKQQPSAPTATIPSQPTPASLAPPAPATDEYDSIAPTGGMVDLDE